MKKYLSLVSALCFASALHAQQSTSTDALRYTQRDLNGTARFKAMSGAFGALGGDLSSLQVNPAGSALFNYNTAAFSLYLTNKKNKSSYLGTNSSDNYSGLDFGQMGAAFVFNNSNTESAWKKFVIGVNYENTTNFNNDIYSRGVSNNSMTNYFLDFANHGNNGQPVPLDYVKLKPNESVRDLYQYLGGLPNGFDYQQAFLGYNAFLLEPTNNNDYVSNVPAGQFLQNNFISSSGFNGKLSANFSTQIGERFYVGTNLNLHFTDYTQLNSLYEERLNYNNEAISEIAFQNELYTYGNGFSFNIGALAKVTENLRLGLSYESPTWYKLNDELTQVLITKHFVAPGERNPFITENVNPNTINIYKSHKIQTPSIYTGSIAYIFGQSGLISFDYTRKDYSKTKFKPEDAFAYQNSELKNLLSSTNEFRVGAEYRIKQVSIRGGYRFEESPYKDSKIIGDLNSFSGGIGYDFGGSRLDLAYVHSARPYDVTFLSSGMSDAARVKTTDNNISLTYSLNF